MEDESSAGTHDLLLALAGRVDDDLLAGARELVAVGEDGHAVELVTASLIADRAPLPQPVRSALVDAARSARTDLDPISGLAPARPENGTEHRFDPGPSDDPVAAALLALPARQLRGCTVLLTRRLTPAGSAPGPLPHPVVLLEVQEGARPRDVLAYQLAVALQRTGVRASVEVLIAGMRAPDYHAEALRGARRIRSDGDGVALSAPSTYRPEPAAVGPDPAEESRRHAFPRQAVDAPPFAAEPPPIEPDQPRWSAQPPPIEPDQPRWSAQPPPIEPGQPRWSAQPPTVQTEAAPFESPGSLFERPQDRPAPPSMFESRQAEPPASPPAGPFAPPRRSVPLAAVRSVFTEAALDQETDDLRSGSSTGSASQRDSFHGGDPTEDEPAGAYRGDVGRGEMRGDDMRGNDGRANDGRSDDGRDGPQRADIHGDDGPGDIRGEDGHGDSGHGDNGHGHGGREDDVHGDAGRGDVVHGDAGPGDDPVPPLPTRRPPPLQRGEVPPRPVPRPVPRPGPSPRPSSVTPISRANGPAPVPLPQRNGPGPLRRPFTPLGTEANDGRGPAPDPPPIPRPVQSEFPTSPSFDPLNDPLDGRQGRPLLQPPSPDHVRPRPVGRQPEGPPGPQGEDSWSGEWLSGAWAMSSSALHDTSEDTGSGRAVPPAPPPEPDPEPEPPAPQPQVQRARHRYLREPDDHGEAPPTVVDAEPLSGPIPLPPARRAIPMPSGRSEPEPSQDQPAREQPDLGLRPESLARLSESDRELLDQLQAELLEGSRPRVSRTAGIGGTTNTAETGPNGAVRSSPNGAGHGDTNGNGRNGDPNRTNPPDLAG